MEICCGLVKRKMIIIKLTLSILWTPIEFFFRGETENNKTDVFFVDTLGRSGLCILPAQLLYNSLTLNLLHLLKSYQKLPNMRLTTDAFIEVPISTWISFRLRPTCVLPGIDAFDAQLKIIDAERCPSSISPINARDL